jgi:hypothetical protein
MAQEAPRDRRNRLQAAVAAAASGLLVLLVSLAIVASGRGGPSEAGDQDKYHLVVIEGMIEQWPAIDVVNYPSATSPGYHALMAAVAQVWPDEYQLLAMRALNALIGSLLPVWCFIVARRFTSATRALALSLPVALDSYVLGGSAYLTTDNAGLLLALIAVGICVGWPVRGWRLLAAGVAATLAVATRQVHLWAAGAPMVAALAALPQARRLAPAFARRWVERAGDTPGARTIIAGATALAAPVLVVAIFATLWGGLVPPAYAQLHNSGPNPAAIPFAFSLAAVIGIALSLVGTPLWRADAWRSRLALWLALAALASALVTPTTFQMKERALGWLWHGVWMSPDIMERSLLITLLAPLGGAVVGMLASAASRRGRGLPAAILLVSLAAWLAAQSMNSMAWQRYFEPILLITLAWLAAMGTPSAEDERAWRRPPLATIALLERQWWIGPIALAALQLTVSALTLLTEVLQAPPARF